MKISDLIEKRNFLIEKVNGDIFIQVYYLDMDLKKAYIIAWINKADLMKYGKKANIKRINYDKWCPLAYGNKMSDLKTHLTT